MKRPKIKVIIKGSNPIRKYAWLGDIKLATGYSLQVQKKKRNPEERTVGSSSQGL